MKTESFEGVKEPNKEQEENVLNPAKDIEIETVAEENGINGLHTRRIDNGMVVRNKKLGGRSSTVIQRFGKLL